MQSLFAGGDPSAVSLVRVDGRGVANRSGMAVLHGLSARVMEMFGPMFWAALIVLFVEAQLIPA